MDDLKERDGGMSRNFAAGIPLETKKIGGFTVTGRWREIGTGGQEVDLTGQ